MSLGRASKIIVTIILVIPFAFQGALAETPPVHENFEDAQKNLEILLSLLEDSKGLSEEALSYLVNKDDSPENLSIAMVKANELHELLLGAEILLQNMQGEAASYEDLVKYLTSFQNLDINLTNLIQYYSSLEENITVTEDYFNETVSSNATADDAFQSLNNTELNIDLVKEKMNDLENNTNAINQNGFSTITMEELIIETKQVVESDENTTKELSKLFKIIPNYLSVYVNKTRISLGDELLIYGYFFAEGSFKARQNITVFMDDQLLAEVFANSTGRYEFKRYIPMNHTLDIFEMHASTIYNGSLYISNRINITVGKIPIILTLSTQFPVYSPKQPITFTGRLIDYRGQGLADKNITLYFNDLLGYSSYFNNITVTNISTDIEGNYSFELDTTQIPIGMYDAKTKFKSEDVYFGGVSRMVNISINIPPILTLSTLETVIYKGENINFFGQLIDEINNTPMFNITIEIYIKDEKVSEVITNNLGRYEYIYSTSGMTVGKYDVHSEFNPNEVRWRKTISNIIEVEIKEPDKPTQEKSLLEKIYDNLFLIIFLVFVLLLVAVLYVKKERPVSSSVDQTQRVSKRSKIKSYPKKELIEKLSKETEDFDGKLKQLSKTKNLREVIIEGYHALLGILEKNKVIKVKPNNTHLDIQQKLTNKGFPSAETLSITKIFEKAMYSNRPMESYILDDLTTNIRKMFARARGTKE